jgi:DNA-directed RNA polymerase specialized sigma24 family protein
LILKFVEHLSNAEIGLVMGRTEGAIKSLYHRTLLSIRDELVVSLVAQQRIASNEGETQPDAQNRDGQRG